MVYVVVQAESVYYCRVLCFVNNQQTSSLFKQHMFYHGTFCLIYHVLKL